MRKVILFAATSLDGYIARKDDDISWLFSDQDYGMSSFFETVDTRIMGRKTYEVELSLGGWPDPQLNTYVVSRDPVYDLRGLPSTQIYTGDVKALVDKLRALASDKDIWLVGGGELNTEFLRRGLLDEIVLSIHPRLLGDGIPLFPQLGQESVLSFMKRETFSTGLVQISYRVEK